MVRFINGGLYRYCMNKCKHERIESMTKTINATDMEMLGKHSRVFYAEGNDFSKMYRVEIYNNTVFIRSNVPRNDGTIIGSCPLSKFEA